MPFLISAVTASASRETLVYYGRMSTVYQTQWRHKGKNVLVRFIVASVVYGSLAELDPIDDGYVTR